MTALTDTRPTVPITVRANGHRPVDLVKWGTPTARQATPVPTPTAAVDSKPADSATQSPGHTSADRWVLSGVSVALGAVILAPIGLSSQDLYAWATAPTGLGLSGIWPYLVPVALDLAAASCIGMTIVAAWRRDRSGVFGLLVWLFALISAYAQYSHGLTEKDAGRALDAWWAMPAFALLGPLLLEVTLKRIRRWARLDHGEQHNGAAGFGTRWLPGVAFKETLSAWAVSRREGIDRADSAVQFVRDQSTLSALSPTEAVHYAVAALRATDQSVDGRSVRVWLSARGTSVVQADIDTVLGGRPTARQVSRTDPTPDRPVAPTVVDTPSVRPAAPVAPDRKPQPAKPRPVAVKADSAVAPTVAVDGHSAAAVANAAELRRRYPDSLTDSDYQIRQATAWSYDRLQKAKAAYAAKADLNGVAS